MVQRPEELKFVRVPRLIFSLQGSTQNSMNWRPPNWTPTLPLAAVWPMPLLASCPPWRRPVHPPGQRLLDTHWHTHTQLCSWLFCFFVCLSWIESQEKKRIWARRRRRSSLLSQIFPSCRPRCWCFPPRWLRSTAGTDTDHAPSWSHPQSNSFYEEPVIPVVFISNFFLSLQLKQSI